MEELNRTFHEATKAARPDEPCKPTTFWVGVLLASQKPKGSKTQDDYLWVKCHRKVTVDKIAQQYKTRHPGDGSVILMHNGKILKNEAMGELDGHRDQTIAIEAIKPSELPSRMESPKQEPQQPSGPLRPQQKSTTPAPASSVIVDKEHYNTPYPEAKIHGQLRSPSKPSSTTQYSTHSPSATVAPSNRTPLSPRDENLPSVGMVSSARPSIPPTTRKLSSKAWGIDTCGNIGPAVPVDSEEDALRNVSARAGNRVKIEASHSSQVSDAEHFRDDQETHPGRQNGDNILEMDFKHQFQAENETVNQSEETRHTSFQLQNFVADASLDVLEKSVEKGVEFLNRLKSPFQEKTDVSPDAKQWLQQIVHLQGQAVKTRTVIGVVGNTGAGKSSVINAMLDEERLVPTNTMRACTAVVTELSYNYANEHKYIAEIEFITVADWEKELQILFQDLLDDNGNVSRDCANVDSDAGIAYAKIKAVYPRKTKEDICNSNVKKMLDDVSHVLGKTRDIKEQESLLFYKKLQRFVDSKEKATGKKDTNQKPEPKEMEFWPLIKVVRIYVKSPALETGAVIVDLPGVHDANAARAAVAEGYMKSCTGLWIVAPIIRAVDDKAAKNLLGESFKRQLKLDGGFSSVTFICSKTDDISLMEASDSLGLEERNGPAWEEIDRCSKKQSELKKDLEGLRETKKTFGEAMQEVDDQLETWEALRESMEDSKTVYAPTTGKKRKRDTTQRSKKKVKLSCSDNEDDDDFIDDGESAAEDDNEEEHSDQELAPSESSPLTEEEISSKFNELRATKKEARRHRTEIDAKMKAVREEISEAKEVEKKIEGEISKVCIEGRNAYSKGAIQQDFAAGMKELDQEIAAEDDEENFNPDENVRDYDEVARSLPVFCVSSRGYQKLQGRLKKDPPVPGFQTLEETEIPQLQAHCKQLTVAGRTATCKRWMTSLSQLLNSMSLWASNDGTGANLTADQRDKEARFLQSSLDNLENGLDKVVSTIANNLKEELAENISDKYETAHSHGMVKSIQTAEDWGRRVNREHRELGGLFWATYKAVCRRNGIFSNGQGLHDWNQALSDPMLSYLASGWERTFTRRFPAVLSGLATNAGNLFRAFHGDIDSRARKVGASIAGLHMLQQQLMVYQDIFKDLAATTRELINKEQKEINREFTPVIERAMGDAYEICTNERGPGSFARMKAHMNAHVEQKRQTMFKDSTKEVQQRLKTMLRQVEEIMANKADEVFVAMSRDYKSVLGGGDVPQGELMPKWQRIMRKAVKKTISRAEKIFKKVAGFEVSDDESEAEEDYHLPLSPVERVKHEVNGEEGTLQAVSSTSIIKMEDVGAPGAEIGATTKPKAEYASIPSRVTDLSPSGPIIGRQNGRHDSREPPTDAQYESLPNYFSALPVDPGDSFINPNVKNDYPKDHSDDPDVNLLHYKEAELASYLGLTCATYLYCKRRILISALIALYFNQTFTVTDAQAVCRTHPVVAVHLWSAFNNAHWLDRESLKVKLNEIKADAHQRAISHLGSERASNFTEIYSQFMQTSLPSSDPRLQPASPGPVFATTHQQTEQCAAIPQPAVAPVAQKPQHEVSIDSEDSKESREDKEEAEEGDDEDEDEEEDPIEGEDTDEMDMLEEASESNPSDEEYNSASDSD